MYSQLFSQIFTFCLFVPVPFFKMKHMDVAETTPCVPLPSFTLLPPSPPEATTVPNDHYGACFCPVTCYI